MRKAYIPSVAELEAFTACARRGTTTMAADSLGLTQSAISRSLASLEDRLGVALFNRVRQRLVLSPAGHAFLDRAEELLAELDAAAMGVMAFGGRDAVLRMAVLPSFARIWLIPRLARFAQVGVSLARIAASTWAMASCVAERLIASSAAARQRSLASAAMPARQRCWARSSGLVSQRPGKRST